MRCVCAFADTSLKVDETIGYKMRVQDEARRPHQHIYMNFNLQFGETFSLSQVPQEDLKPYEYSVDCMKAKHSASLQLLHDLRS